MPSKAEQLEQIKADILRGNVCPDLAEQATNLVMGDGNADADIVFIGEAPGKSEDLQGLPFVGAAGKFLNEMLLSVSLERKDIYITNIVKYRPPNNRDPLPDEKRAFWPYLVRQLRAIDPVVVVTLGRHSMEYFLPDAKISQVHGEPVHLTVKYGPELAPVPLVVVPLFHPAAALYNGGLRQTLLEDFSKLHNLVETIKQERKY